MRIHQADNSVVTLRSELLDAIGVPHGFSTRIGGVSVGPFAGLNLGPHHLQDQPQDEPANRQENERRLIQAISSEKRAWVKVRQVHGDRVVMAQDASLAPDEQADAIITDQAGLLLSVRVADCVPVLIASQCGRWVAAVHAGWRGVVADIAGQTVRQMAGTFGASPQRLVAAVGPCIGPQAFEVGREVIQAFRQAGLDSCIRSTDSVTGQGHVDLAASVAHQLRRSGLPTSAIELSGFCTVQRSDLFFSHRRDRGLTGRMAAAIGPLSHADRPCG